MTDAALEVAPSFPPDLQWDLVAEHFFERIDVRTLNAQTDAWVASSPTTVRLSDGGYAICLRYGVIVFAGASDSVRQDFLGYLETLGNQRRTGDRESERVRVRVDSERGEGWFQNNLYTKDASVQRVQLIAEVLARSVILASYEAVLRETANTVEPLARELSARGQSEQSPRSLLKQIGSALLIRQQLVARAEVTEKPELLWERPELERLYMQLMDEFEIDERNGQLEAKMSVITDTTRTALDLVRHGNALRVEWYIVALIVVEIILGWLRRG
ncbi:MAG TPA: RMD1 family protein [Polyangiaceae bacterium]|jgi:uncharacterized Rmd1/YagE family protein|nr:RMD1 family protein [Polyangiaceae bacterium]